jgi:hypothetical protein
MLHAEVLEVREAAPKLEEITRRNVAQRVFGNGVSRTNVAVS